MKIVSRAAIAGVPMLLIAALAGATPLADPVVVTEEDGGKTITLKVGDTVQVRLRSNRSTGYHWTVKKYDTRLFAEKSPETYVPPEHVIPGAPGAQVFAYKSLHSGKTDMTWTYVPPGTKHRKAPGKTLKIRFKIRK